MKEEQKNILILMTSMLAVGLIGFVVLQKQRGKKSIGQEQEENDDNSTKEPTSLIIPKGLSNTTSDFISKSNQITQEQNRLAEEQKKALSLYLGDIPKTVFIPTRTTVTIKDRNKFFDEWAAEEGGKESIQEMYKKNPSRFTASDVQYLKSKKILV